MFWCECILSFPPTNSEDEEQPTEGTGEGGDEQKPAAAPVKRSAWARPGAKKAPKGGAGAKNKHKPAPKVKQPVTQKQSTDSNKTAAQEKPTGSKDPLLPPESDVDSAAEDSDNEVEKIEPSVDGSSDDENDKKVSSVEDDDDEWDKFQQKLNKREKLEGKSKVSHSVHCPNFPEDKQEYWWTYICDRKSRTLLTAPYHVTNLVDKEEVQLKFTAPRWPGVYSFTVCLRSGESSEFNRIHSFIYTIMIQYWTQFFCFLFLFALFSDSYVGMDQQLELKLDVKEAPAVVTEHPQWDISESESEKEDPHANESEFTTDSSDDED